jgi:hypothetical protein
MSTVHIKIDTGYHDADHEFDTGLDAEDWNSLGDDDRNEIFSEAVWNFIGVEPYVPGDDSVELK